MVGPCITRKLPASEPVTSVTPAFHAFSRLLPPVASHMGYWVSRSRRQLVYLLARFIRAFRCADKLSVKRGLHRRRQEFCILGAVAAFGGEQWTAEKQFSP